MTAKTATVVAITKNKDGFPNGRLIPVWNATELPGIEPPAQVYVTTVYPSMSKGPHLHMKRRGLFCCIRGEVKIVLKRGDNYEVHRTGEISGSKLIEVPAGVPSMIISESSKESFIINMPTPAWSHDDQDDVPVEGWTYES